MVRIDGLYARKQASSKDGRNYFSISFPSDRIGVSIVNLRFESEQKDLLLIAPKIAATVRLKARPTGAQRFVSLEPCEEGFTPRRNPWTIKTLKISIEETRDKNSSDAWNSLAQQIVERGIDFRLSETNESELRAAGANSTTWDALQKVEPRELDDQTKVYENFLESYSLSVQQSSDVEKLKGAYESGIKFLSRWQCDPLWAEQTGFLKNWLPRIESRIGFYTLY